VQTAPGQQLFGLSVERLIGVQVVSTAANNPQPVNQPVQPAAESMAAQIATDGGAWDPLLLAVFGVLLMCIAEVVRQKTPNEQRAGYLRAKLAQLRTRSRSAGSPHAPTVDAGHHVSR
jgi:hypothetical protein